MPDITAFSFMMWSAWRHKSTPLLVSAVWQRRSQMREWAHRYALRRGWRVILTDGSYIRRYMPTSDLPRPTESELAP